MKTMCVLLCTAVIAIVFGGPRFALRHERCTASGSPAAPVQAAAGVARWGAHPFLAIGPAPDGRPQFVACLGSVAARAEPAAIALSLTDSADARRGAVVRLAFEDARSDGAWEADDAGQGVFHAFLGSDAGCRRTGLSGHARLRASGIYDGIDVVLRTEAGRFEYDVLVAPFADLTDVRVRVEGAESLQLRDDGALVVHTAAGDLVQPPPVTWETGADGVRVPVATAYCLLDDTSYGLVSPGRDPRLALVVDPGLIFSTYLGGTLDDQGWLIKQAANGELVVASSTSSTNFPTTPGAYDTGYNGGGSDIVISRLSADGSTLLSSTFLGGSAGETSFGLIIDADGSILVAGSTHSSNFPTTAGAHQQGNGGVSNSGFITRLQANGAALLASTYFGQIGVTGIEGLALASDGDVVVTGSVSMGGAAFVTTPGAFDTTFNGVNDAFVARLDGSLSSLVFSTYLGGNDFDVGRSVAVGPTGDIVVAGETFSFDFPTTPGAFMQVSTGINAFVSRIDAAGQSLLASTYVGGSGEDSVVSVIVGADGNVTLAGSTTADDFPVTAGAFDTVFADGASSSNRDGFVSRLDPMLGALVFSTYLGGQWSDDVASVAVDSGGAVTVCGVTSSETFPTTVGAFDTTSGSTSQSDAFVLRLSCDGSTLHYASCLGGPGKDDTAFDVAPDGEGAVTVIGRTQASDFPVTPGAWDTTINGTNKQDVFVTRMDLLPTGAARTGVSSPACNGAIACSVTAMPKAGGAFALTCTNAPPSANGVLVVGGASLPGGLAVKGISLLVAPPFVILPLVSGPDGSLELPIPLAPGFVGLTGYLQLVWFGTPSCGGTGTYSSTAALAITVQP